MENNENVNVVNTNETSVNQSVEQAGTVDTIKNTVGGLKNKLGDKAPIIAIAAVGVIFLLVIVLLLSGGGDKRAVKAYYKGYMKMDAEKVVDRIYVDEKDDRKDAKKDLKEDFEDMEDDDIKYKSFKIVDSFRANKDELEEIAEGLENIYDIDEEDVTAAATFAVRVEIDDDGDRKIEYEQVGVFKLEGKWYVLSFN